MNKLLAFSKFFEKCAQLQGESYGYEEDPAYTSAKAWLENPELLNKFYGKFPNDVVALTKYVDANSRVQIDVSYNQGKYQVTSPVQLPGNILNNLNRFMNSVLPKSKDPNTKFTTNVFWTLSLE